MITLSTVDGKVDAVGQFYLNGKAGVSYTLVRFISGDGQIVSFKNVAVDNELNTYLQPGTVGRYCFYPYKEAQVLCGFKNASRTHVGQEQDDPTVLVLGMQRKAFKLRMAASALLSIICVGIPFVIYWASRLNSLNFTRPSSQEITAELSKPLSAGPASAPPPPPPASN